jgi:hypothetical protein
VAGKIIADIIEAPYDSIRMNVANVTVLTANNSGLTYLPTGNVNINIGSTASLTLGNVTVSNLITANGGIKFPATQVVSADVNTLDDYEEGTWTPIAAAQTGSITSYTSDGTYTKIGDLVFVRGRVLLTNVGTAGGTLNMSGLPFTTSAGLRPFIGVAREDSVTGNTFLTYSNVNATIFTISALTNVGAITWTNNYSYIWSVTYKAA